MVHGVSRKQAFPGDGGCGRPPPAASFGRGIPNCLVAERCWDPVGWAGRTLGVEHRKTKPYTPRTNGLVERCNGRVQREALGLTVASHRDLERLLVGFTGAHNARRQRVLDGRSPEAVVRERLARAKTLANPSYRPPSDPCILPKALLAVEAAKEVSPPDN